MLRNEQEVQQGAESRRFSAVCWDETQMVFQGEHMGIFQHNLLARARQALSFTRIPHLEDLQAWAAVNTHLELPNASAN